MELALKEIKYYDSGHDFYQFDKKDKCEYRILLVEGYKGDKFYTFISGTDYELFNDGIRWLDGDKPEAPPSFISSSGRIPFEISYFYEDIPARGADLIAHPFVKPDGRFITVLHSFTNQLTRIFHAKNNVMRSHDLNKAGGLDLDHLASWFNVIRFSAESDDGLRGRLMEYLDAYISSGTRGSVSAAVEAYTGTTPEIAELFFDISYFNYNADDYAQIENPDQWRVYLFEGGAPDPDEYTYQAYFWDPLYQLNTFFCILPYSVISEYGVDNIKIILDKAKSAGVTGYLGWLIDEDFSETLNDWTEVQPGSGFSINANDKLEYTGTTPGTIITNKTGSDEWGHYLMTGYANLVDSPTSVNHRIGFVLRYQDSNNYYFAGFATDKTNGNNVYSTYEVWKKESDVYTRIPNQYNTGNNNEGSGIYALPDAVGINGVMSPNTEYHLRVQINGRTLRMYISNILVFENTTELTDFTEGEVGMEVFTKNSDSVEGEFDSIKLVA